ncbi:MAG: hypothetical protein LBE27_07350, partial [Deltaproteobacteria bacterium]|nr:hypothetical protein [Deltaproteobacteria bacterium]
MYTAVDKEGGSDTRLKVVAPQKLERKKIYEREECFPPSRDSRDSLGREGIVRPKGAGSPSPGALGASIKIAPGKKALRAQAMKKAERPPHTLKGLENVENPEIDNTRETKPQGEKKPLRWLEPIKWLTKLFLSAIFLAWIFVLGILVGRGSLINNPHSGTQGLIPFTSKAALSPQGQALEEPESYAGTSSSVPESPDPGPLGYYQRGESPKLQLQRAPEPRGVGKVTSAQSGLLPPMTTSTLPAPEKDPKAPEKPIEAPTKDISQPSLNYESPFAIALTGEGTGALVRPQAEPPSAMRPNLPTAAISVAGDMVSPSPALENPSALNPPAEAAAEATIEATAPSTQAVASGEKAPEAPKVKDNPQ